MMCLGKGDDMDELEFAKKMEKFGGSVYHLYRDKILLEEKLEKLIEENERLRREKEEQ